MSKSKRLSKLAICRMIRNHFSEEQGFDAKGIDDESETFERTCPSADLNNILNLKNYVKWGEGLICQQWDIDVQDLIFAHAFVLNLSMQPLGDDVIKKMIEIREMKRKEKTTKDLINKLEDEASNLHKDIQRAHYDLFKTSTLHGKYDNFGFN